MYGVVGDPNVVGVSRTTWFPSTPKGHQIGCPVRRGSLSLSTLESRGRIPTRFPLVSFGLIHERTRVLEGEHPSLTDTEKVVSTSTTQVELLPSHTKTRSPVRRCHEAVSGLLNLKRRGDQVTTSTSVPTGRSPTVPTCSPTGKTSRDVGMTTTRVTRTRRKDVISSPFGVLNHRTRLSFLMCDFGKVVSQLPVRRRYRESM